MSRDSVWRIAAAEGASVKAGEPTVIAESMKMEIVVAAPATGACTSCIAGKARRSQPDRSSW
jgi:biotin carboxyl carrier protein